MKLETALRYTELVYDRLQSIGGLLPTPTGDWEFVRFDAVWVFGSTVKGSIAPNDLDLLIAANGAGARQSHRVVGHDPDYLRRYGMLVAKDSRKMALKWLTSGTRGISRHLADQEAVEIDVKVMLYPRNDLARGR